MSVHDWEVVWTGSLERQAVEAARREAIAAQRATVTNFDARPNDENAADLVRDYIARYPGCGMREIAVATCLSWQAASRAIHALHEASAITSSSTPREGMRWRMTKSTESATVV